MSHDVPNRNWSYPTAIKFGVGRIAELADHCTAAGIKKPFSHLTIVVRERAEAEDK